MANETPVNLVDEIEITKLKFPDNIRKRPGMYIGATDAPNHIIQEVIDNSVDEVLAGYGKNVYIHTNDKSAIIIDDGRGIPVYIDKDFPDNDRTITQSLFTETHVGSKFDQSGDGKAFSRGLNGVDNRLH